MCGGCVEDAWLVVSVVKSTEAHKQGVDVPKHCFQYLDLEVDQDTSGGKRVCTFCDAHITPRRCYHCAASGCKTTMCGSCWSLFEAGALSSPASLRFSLAHCDLFSVGPARDEDHWSPEDLLGQYKALNLGYMEKCECHPRSPTLTHPRPHFFVNSYLMLYWSI